MNHDRALVCSRMRGGEAGSSEGWMDDGATVCQVEDGLTSGLRYPLNETEGVQIDEARLRKLTSAINRLHGDINSLSSF